MSETCILALDTATDIGSVALSVGDDILESVAADTRANGPRILEMIDSLLKRANVTPDDLDALAFGRGPGAFTGVRIGASLVQGLALVRDLPVVPVSSLAALAQAPIDDHGWSNVLVCTDARMGEVYAAAFVRDEDGFAMAVGSETLCGPDAVELPDGNTWRGAGSGWRLYPEMRERLGSRLKDVDETVAATASHIVRLARRNMNAAVDAADALPVYLRDKVAWKKSS